MSTCDKKCVLCTTDTGLLINITEKGFRSLTNAVIARGETSKLDKLYIGACVHESYLFLMYIKTIEFNTIGT